MHVEWHGSHFELLPERAVCWPARQTLIIADPHFGKDAAFRAGGVPVPGGTTAADLARLNAALDQTQAQRLIILGDFLHAARGRSVHTMALLSAWRADRPGLNIILVRGNHDAHAGDPPDEWQFACVNEPFSADGFTFWHHAAAARSERMRAAFAGHVHPCAILHDEDGSMHKAACFHFGKSLATLPAFGGFTGTHPIEPKAGDRIFIVAHGIVHDVRAVASSRR